MIRQFCDRCGNEADARQTAVHLSYRVTNDKNSVLRLDLCVRCERELMKFLIEFPQANLNITSDYIKVV